MKPWVAVTVVSVLCAALYLPYLGSLELRGEEPRRILVAVNMMESGDWLVPHIGGSIYQKKPPLINWSIAAAFLGTGLRSDWVARLPSVLWIGGFAIAAALSLRRRLGDWGAVSTGLFFMSTVAMMDKGHSAEIEPMYAAQTGIAFVLWAAWWSEGRFWRAYTIPWVFLGLGMLTKGPPHLALFYLLVIPSLLFGRRIKDLWSPQHLAGLLLMSAIFLPWTLANLQLTGKAGDTAKTWAGEAAERVQVTGINWKSWLIRPFQMLADFLPWTPLLILGWWRNRSIDSPPNPEQEQWQSSEEERWNHLIRGTRWGLLIGLAILLLLPHGTARYAQPLFPALCVLLVDQFRRLNPTLQESLSKHWARTNAVAGWLIAVASVAAAIFVPERLGSNPVPAWTGALIAVAAAALPLVLATRSMVLPALVQSCLVMATAAGVGLSYAGVYMDQHGDLRQNGRTMTALFSEPDRPVIFYDTDYFRSVYYLRRPYREIDGSSELPQGPAYLVLPAKNVSRGAVKRLLRTHEITELAKPTWEEKQMVVLKVDPRPKP